MPTSPDVILIRPGPTGAEQQIQLGPNALSPVDLRPPTLTTKPGGARDLLRGTPPAPQNNTQEPTPAAGGTGGLGGRDGNGGGDNRNRPDRESSPGGKPPGWWHLDQATWERLDPEPRERFVKGAALVIKDYDETLRYGDRQVRGVEFGRYVGAAKDFLEYAMHDELFGRHAVVVAAVERRNKHEEEAVRTRINDPRERVLWRLKIYKQDRLSEELNRLEMDNVVEGGERNQLYNQIDWERALQRKKDIE